MKQLLLSFICAFSTGLFAQIEITNTTFPELGDTLRTATDNIPENIDLGSSGADQTWDFSNLSSNVANETVYLDPMEGTAADEVPNANMLVLGIAGESYYQSTDTELLLLAGKGSDPAGFGISAVLRFLPPIVERRAPLNFGDVNTAESNASFALPADALPDTITQSFPFPIDSIRIRLNQESIDIVDAYGNLTIPGGTFDVLREKRTLIRETRIDVLTFLGWTDVTDLIAGLTGGAGLGEITTIRYLFYNDESKEIIADITTDETGDNIGFATYKFLGVLNSSSSNLIADENVNLFPNPAQSEVSLELKNLKPDFYTLRIYNMLGMNVWQKQLFIDGNQTEKVNLNEFQSGSYIYSIENKEGEIFLSKNLTITK